MQILYIILSIFGLGFLVFIHELGHYFMARRVGMTVEAFSIGFGKPILSWDRKGVKWQVGWLPFGGFVRIKGMEKKGSIEPYEIPDGFFGKSPLARIKVALMGPTVNILFAFLAFCGIWASGGREKKFSDFTHVIGTMDPCSALYAKGVHPGDTFESCNGSRLRSFQDLFQIGVTSKTDLELQGYKIDFATMQQEPYAYTLTPYPHPLSPDPAFKTIGIMGAAQFLVFDRATEAEEPLFHEGSPLFHSGIQDQDRIAWVDGEPIFSMSQLTLLINDTKALLTVQRDGKNFLTRIPRLKVGDIKFSTLEKAELDDWQHEAGLHARVDQLLFIPYAINHNGVIEKEIAYLDESAKECKFGETVPTSSLAIPLQPGDKILAIDGIPINSAVNFIQGVQKRQVRIIVERLGKLPKLSWKEVDDYFLKKIDWPKMTKIVDSLGTPQVLERSGDFVLLAPITPLALADFPLSPSQKSWVTDKENAQKKMIEAIENPKQKAEAQRIFENNQKQLKLGIRPQDLPVNYNPSPFAIFGDVFQETGRTLISLFSGTLSPKWMSGPVGIVEVIRRGWLDGVQEALFWLGLISLNLGILNLLPIPVLDGGHVCFSLVEMVTKKPIKAKTMERLIIPFIVLLIIFFVYITYNDLIRLFGKFFR